MKDMDNQSFLGLPKDMKKTRLILRLVGWILIICDIGAFFIGGKGALFTWSAVLLITYAIYVIWYPYICIISPPKEKTLQPIFKLPVLGGLIAMAVLLLISTGNYDYRTYMILTVCIAAALVIPFVIKALKTDVKQRLGRKISVICCACMIAFAVNYPLNVILTFDDAIHENVTVTKKSINSYWSALNVNQKGSEDLYSISERHYLYVKQNDSVKRYGVLRTQYATTSVGDQKKLYIQRSVLGLKYYTIHEMSTL